MFVSIQENRGAEPLLIGEVYPQNRGLTGGTIGVKRKMMVSLLIVSGGWNDTVVVVRT